MSPSCLARSVRSVRSAAAGPPKRSELGPSATCASADSELFCSLFHRVLLRELHEGANAHERGASDCPLERCTSDETQRLLLHPFAASADAARVWSCRRCTDDQPTHRSTDFAPLVELRRSLDLKVRQSSSPALFLQVTFSPMAPCNGEGRVDGKRARDEHASMRAHPCDLNASVTAAGGRAIRQTWPFPEQLASCVFADCLGGSVRLPARPPPALPRFRAQHAAPGHRSAAQFPGPDRRDLPRPLDNVS